MQHLENTWNKFVSNCVGFVINVLNGAHVKRMLFLLSAEVMRGLPKVVVRMIGLKCNNFERMNTRIVRQ